MIQYFWSALLPLIINILVIIFFNTQIKKYGEDGPVIPKMIFTLICIGSLVPYISYGIFITLILSAVIEFSNKEWYFTNIDFRDFWKN